MRKPRDGSVGNNRLRKLRKYGVCDVQTRRLGSVNVGKDLLTDVDHLGRMDLYRPWGRRGTPVVPVRDTILSVSLEENSRLTRI